MSRHAGPSMIRFSPDFFGWSRRQLIIIDDYPYARMDFCDDPKLEFLEGMKWDASGKIL